MKSIARIPAVFRDRIGEQVFNDLLRIYPAGDCRPQHHVFECFLPLEDPRTRRILDRLASAGFQPWTETDREMNDESEYILDLEREYEPADLVTCPFLELGFVDGAHNFDTNRAPAGTLVVPESGMLPGGFDFIAGDSYTCIVPERVKSVLEGAGLRGVRLRPTYYHSDDRTIQDTHETVRARHGDPYWELDSDARMRPLSPSMVLLDDDGRRVPRAYLGPCFPEKDGLYIHTELRYRESDVAGLELDLARIFERFQSYGAPADRPLIASQRFYRFCEDHGLKAKWIPVRIDPD